MIDRINEPTPYKQSVAGRLYDRETKHARSTHLSGNAVLNTVKIE
jgi:hypothetical protein